jgi:hypothetical protein
LSADDLQSCLRQLAGMKPKDEVLELRAGLMRAWAKSDPDAAWKAALATKDKEWRTSILCAVAGELAKTSPERAIQLALSLGMGSDRATVLSAVFNDWAKVNPSAAIAYGNSHPELPTGDYGLNGAVTSLAQKDPVQAANLALTLASPNARQSAFYNIFNSWMRKDAEGARQWMLSIADPTVRDQAIEAYINSGVVGDPQQAFALTDQISSVDARREAVRNAISNWMRKDPVAAMDYLAAKATNNPDENLGWSIGYAMNALTAAEQNQLLAKLPDGEMKTRTITNLASNQVYRGQYSQAVAALNMLPDCNERDYALTNLGQGWGKTNGQTLTQWLNQQPDSSDRDLVVAGYVSSLANTNPQSAIQWANTIPDKKIQDAAYKNIASRWFMTDPNAARAWMNSNAAISEQERKDIETNAQKGRSVSYTPQVSVRR